MMLFVYAPYLASITFALVFFLGIRLRLRRGLARSLVLAGAFSTWLSFDYLYALSAALTPKSDAVWWAPFHASRAICVVFVGLLAAKLLAVSSWPSAGRLRGHRFWLYLLWPDVDPEPFWGPRVRPSGGTVSNDLRLGTLWTTVGLGLWALLPELPEHSRPSWLVTLVGASLIAHFGVLRLACGALRALGIPVRPLFSRPIGSRSLHEFWGRRWNRAFSNLMRVVVVRPLSKRGRRSFGVFLSFVGSALLHEMALTWPVYAGIGGPTVYFLLQAGAHALEARFRPQGLGPVWVFVVVAFPMPLLFPLEWTSLLESGIRLVLDGVGIA